MTNVNIKKYFNFKSLALLLVLISVYLFFDYRFKWDSLEIINSDKRGYTSFQYIGDYFLKNDNLIFYTLYPDKNTKNRIQIADSQILSTMQQLNINYVTKNNFGMVEFFFKKEFDVSKKQCVYLYQKNNDFKNVDFAQKIKVQLFQEYGSKFWRYKLIPVNTYFAKWCLIGY